MTDQGAKASTLRSRLLDYALGLPEAYLDHPWGEDVAKVRGKVFVFFGEEGHPQSGLTVKLRESNALALAQPGVTPSGYNLGKSGWVTVPWAETAQFEMLRDWIDESYRLVAPRRVSERARHSA